MSRSHLLPRLFWVPVLCAALLVTPQGLRAADVPPAEIKKAVGKGVAYLKKEMAKPLGGGKEVLVAYALLKTGEPATSPEIAKVIEAIQKRCQGDKYRPDKDHFYTAGLELMLLADVDSDATKAAMTKILTYVVTGLQPYGAWHYPNQEGQGDTSITQYAALGLWAAERAELDVPPAVWDRLAVWHLRTQRADGGFGYHPGRLPESTATMSVAGTANLLLVHRHLFSQAPQAQTPKTDRRFGLLQEIDPNQLQPSSPGTPAGYTPQATRPAVEQSAARSLAWTESRFKQGVSVSPEYPYYYLYGIERMAALANVEQLGGISWYQAGASLLVSRQATDGSWPGEQHSGPEGGTAFALLFLVRATGKTLGVLDDSLGGGLLAGGRGLPLAAAPPSKTNAPPEDLDQLLARLESSTADLPSVQQALLERVRFGERESLVGQRDRLTGLVRHPEPEVRRTALWAIGRGGDLTQGGLLIRGLSDCDPAVAAEAHAALCWLARRPEGWGIDSNPLAEAPEDAPPAARAEAFNRWRRIAMERWSAWFARNAPYGQREGLGPLPRGRLSDCLPEAAPPATPAAPASGAAR